MTVSELIALLQKCNPAFEVELVDTNADTFEPLRHVYHDDEGVVLSDVELEDIFEVV